MIFNKTENMKNLISYIKYTDNLLENEKKKSIHPSLIRFVQEIKDNKYKGIVIYPLAVNWEPVQRPHHLLRKLGEEGYLCFFCESSKSDKFEITQKYKNLYLVNKQEKLLPLLMDEKVIILVTYFLQYLYAKHFKDTKIWLDILDKLEFMSFYNKYSKKIYSEVIKNADIVTYSANNLKKYLKNRSDAILLENAVNLEDFILEDNASFPKDLEKIIDKKKKIIGYYGAIENWFDFDLIKEIDDYYNVVLIGKVNSNLNVKKYNFKNVHFLGAKKFNELKKYAKNFDVAIIPFKINKVTNSVSPVKFYEYLALNKPVVTTNIKEMKKYQCEIVRIVNSKNIKSEIDGLLRLDKKIIKKKCMEISSNNTWNKRIKKVSEML